MSLLTILNLILLAALLYKSFGQSMTASGGVTLALINSTASPILEIVFEYPGGKFSTPKFGVREQVAHSITHVADFEATLRFQDDQGHQFQERVRVRPYGEMLVLLEIQSVLKTSVITNSEGKEQTVIEASPNKVTLTRSYQRPGWESK